jgi:hypothetical protein
MLVLYPYRFVEGPGEHNGLAALVSVWLLPNTVLIVTAE